MTQLSRPYQIALLALGLLAAVWFVALRGHSTSSESTPAASSPPPTSTTPLGQAEAKSAAAPSPIYHGPAPGVGGLTRAIAKAHEAVATSQREVKQREEQSAAASSATSTGTGAAGAPAQPTPTAKTSGGSAPATRAPSSAAKTGSTSAPSMQAAVESELKQGKIVTILFWNPKGTDDVAVRRELQAANTALGTKVVVHEASAGQVGSFGTITRSVQVYQTPTIMIVNKHGQVTTLTGFIDAFSIEQAIKEARK